MGRTKEVARRGYREVLPRREPVVRIRKPPPQPNEPHSESEKNSDLESDETSNSESEENHDSESEEYSDPESEEVSEPPEPPPRAQEAVVPKREQKLFSSSDQSPEETTAVENKRPIIMTIREEHQVRSSDQPPEREVKRENCCPDSQENAKNPGISFADENVGISLDDFVQQSGEKLEEIGEALGVTRPTLKRIHQELETYCRPLLKRYKLDDIRSNTSVDPVGGDTIKTSENRPCSNDNATTEVALAAILTEMVTKSYRAERNHTMIVEATYRGDTVKFPLCSNSGIEKLRRELDKRFELKVESFKIKYKDDGKWFMLCCNEDLRFHMDGLNASGLTMMELSVSLPN
ncbi:OLC1v1030093C2 [Oldenlandia corymbosa var. corymbosa]|uniref:OLC1v1030093C2 n=1 Tax=Oldenlandia corymbosa var. corymbosa TaxID=529605 RepID=A0AAV1CGT7_OLDCO|nr:OLC1v1030093C2 [Oldenlandia corymbosa var. corymbosa]